MSGNQVFLGQNTTKAVISENMLAGTERIQVQNYTAQIIVSNNVPDG